MGLLVTLLGQAVAHRAALALERLGDDAEDAARGGLGPTVAALAAPARKLI